MPTPRKKRRTKIATQKASPAGIARLIENEQQSLIDAQGIKKVGYLCAYTPLELLGAAGVKRARLLKGGNPDTVAHGELHTQSAFCDFTKSCIGGFEEGDPLYRSFDKIYNFHSCSSMKRASEAIAQFVPTKMLNLPRLRDEQSSRNFFREEILNLKRDLENLTGTSITDEEVRRQIVLHNQARLLLKKFSELRKRKNPPLSGKEYLELVRGYYYLPPETLLPSYEELYRRYEKPGRAAKRDDKPRLRLMVSGSIVADGDRRLLDIVEDELGADVVIEDHCAGFRPFHHLVPETGDPYQALADGYLDQAPCARMKPLSESVEFSARLAQEYNVDGVLYVYLKFCACHGISKIDFTTRFQEIGLPTLEISSDYSQSDHGQLKTRLEAFVEMLNDQKNIDHEQYANA